MLDRLGAVKSAVSEKQSEGSDFSSEISDADTIEQAKRLLHVAAGGKRAGEPVKTAIGRAAICAGFSITRARDIWYGDARRIDASEMDALRRLERERTERQRTARREKLSAIEQLAALRARLSANDPQFFKPDLDAIDFVLEKMRE